MGKFIPNPPDSRPFIEASRSFGNYELQSALADLIDNSITAKCNTVEIDCNWNEGDPIIKIKDDGNGMSQSELNQAMKHASSNPTKSRDLDDLGRFGLGMKTASFSQAKRLTVVSKTSEIAGARWDIDNVSDNWLMEVLDEDELEKISKLHEIDESGTEIIWEKTDRLTENREMTKISFDEVVSNSMKEISKIFHRFLEPESKKYSKIDIIVNGSELQALDPFYRENPATQRLQQEKIPVKDGQIEIRPYILPHYTKIKPAKYEELGGHEGFIKNQGFYVYRNRRLIIYGTWFKILKHSPLTNLTRISIDIPNSIDFEWKISVDKSDLQIPSYLKKRLREVVEKNVNASAIKVYKGKSLPLDQSKNERVWNKTQSSDGTITYSVNTDHPFIKWFISTLNEKQSDYFKKVILNLVAKNIPAPSIYYDIAKNPKDVSSMSDDEKQIREMVKNLLETGLSKIPEKEFDEIFAEGEPFASHMDIVRSEIQVWRNNG